MCSTGCGLDVHVSNDEIQKVAPMPEHIYNTSCVKAETQAIRGLVYSKDRLLKPMLRSNGELKETSWDIALNYIADRLVETKKRHGARSLAYNTGNAFIRSHTEKLARRFCDLYGTPNYTSGGSYCFFSRRFGHGLTFNHAGATAQPDWNGTECTIIWGANPDESEHRLVPEIESLCQRGGKLMVIDPRSTRLAKMADYHAQLRPGTDCALALGMIHTIIDEGLYDNDFIQDWTVGFEALCDHVRDYSPEKVADITGVSAETIRVIARTYARKKPANIIYGAALEHCISGVQANRAIAILIGITGNLETFGGNVWQPRPPKGLTFGNLRLPEKVDLDSGIGAEYPVYNKITMERTAMAIPDAILYGKPYPIKALIVHGTEPLSIWPNTLKMKQALKSLDLMVVIDLFLTETAEMADVVLPAASFLETGQFKDYTGTGPAVVAIGEPAINPIGESHEDWKIIAEMGTALGYGEYFPWRDSDELFQFLLGPTGITLEQLKCNRGGISYAHWEQKRYLKEGFNTPSGKFEIYSKTLAGYSYHPLPTYIEPAESPLSRPDLYADYPFILVTGIKTRYYTHSRHRNVEFLHKQMPEPLLTINLEDASRLGIQSGEKVLVESPRGGIRLIADPSEDVRPGVVMMQHGWQESNANILTDDLGVDPISAYLRQR